MKILGEERRQRLTLTIIITYFVFLALTISMLILIGVAMVLMRHGVLSSLIGPLGLMSFVIILILASNVVGAVVSFLFIRLSMVPINSLIDGLDGLTSGKYDTRMEPKTKWEKWLYKLHVVATLAESFNALAVELENTELLRSDFINNFSHEFKTPIVSIAGYAKLLKRGNLSEEQRLEYLGIIEEESLRLSSMATNVLNLTKVENQTILINQEEYNLSEQLRTCVLLLEAKWAKKGLEPDLRFDEIQINGSEELLKQVWINLLDNAIKFAPEGSIFGITASTTPQGVVVCVENEGSKIPEYALPKIFNKFYQADESHAVMGNGIGLAIVKRIIDLHAGHVEVLSQEGKIIFKVYLPK